MIFFTGLAAQARSWLWHYAYTKNIITQGGLGTTHWLLFLINKFDIENKHLVSLIRCWFWGWSSYYWGGFGHGDELVVERGQGYYYSPAGAWYLEASRGGVHQHEHYTCLLWDKWYCGLGCQLCDRALWWGCQFGCHCFVYLFEMFFFSNLFGYIHTRFIVFRLAKKRKSKHMKMLYIYFCTFLQSRHYIECLGYVSWSLAPHYHMLRFL